MRRFLVLLLTCSLLLPCLFGCAVMMQPSPTDEHISSSDSETEKRKTESGEEKTAVTETEKEPAAPIPQSPQEEKILKILILGNSHSLDAFQLLWQVFQAQFPEQKLVLGVMYYSGCSISQHVEFSLSDKPVYRYCKNVTGKWLATEEYTMERALRDQCWDFVMLQAAKSDLNDTLNEKSRRRLEDFVDRCIPTEHRFVWHTSWPSPNDETFFSPDYWRRAPAGYKENLIRLYGFDPVRQFTVLTEMAKTHILTDPTYSAAYCSGSAIMYAHRVLGVPQIQIWRDYTHLNDYGRLLAAYALYAQITGREVDEVKIDSVPAAMRQAHYREEGDLLVTEEMKRVIQESANHSLRDPWSVPLG